MKGNYRRCQRPNIHQIIQDENKKVMPTKACKLSQQAPPVRVLLTYGAGAVLG